MEGSNSRRVNFVEGSAECMLLDLDGFHEVHKKECNNQPSGNRRVFLDEWSGRRGVCEILCFGFYFSLGWTFNCAKFMADLETPEGVKLRKCSNLLSPIECVESMSSPYRLNYGTAAFSNLQCNQLIIVLKSNSKSMEI